MFFILSTFSIIKDFVCPCKVNINVYFYYTLFVKAYIVQFTLWKGM